MKTGIIILSLLISFTAFGQKNLKPDERNTPIFLYPKKQEGLRKKLHVIKSTVLRKNSKGKVDTSKVEIFNKEGQIHRVKYKSTPRVGAPKKNGLVFNIYMTQKQEKGQELYTVTEINYLQPVMVIIQNISRGSLSYLPPMIRLSGG